jgi:NAD-dependent SIR2 family protein deacetylase
MSLGVRLELTEGEIQRAAAAAAAVAATGVANTAAATIRQCGYRAAKPPESGDEKEKRLEKRRATDSERRAAIRKVKAASPAAEPKKSVDKEQAEMDPLELIAQVVAAFFLDSRGKDSGVSNVAFWYGAGASYTFDELRDRCLAERGPPAFYRAIAPFLAMGADAITSNHDALMRSLLIIGGLGRVIALHGEFDREGCGERFCGKVLAFGTACTVHKDSTKPRVSNVPLYGPKGYTYRGYEEAKELLKKKKLLIVVGASGDLKTHDIRQVISDFTFQKPQNVIVYIDSKRPFDSKFAGQIKGQHASSFHVLADGVDFMMRVRCKLGEANPRDVVVDPGIQHRWRRDILGFVGRYGPVAYAGTQHGPIYRDILWGCDKSILPDAPTEEEVLAAQAANCTFLQSVTLLLSS